MKEKKFEIQEDVLPTTRGKNEVTIDSSGGSPVGCRSQGSALNRERANVPKEDGETGTYITVPFHLEGMSCQSCSRKIEEVLFACSGVKEVDIDFAQSEAVIHFNRDTVGIEDLYEAVEGIGYLLIEKHPIEPQETPSRFLHQKRFGPYLIGACATFGLIGFDLGLLTLTSGWYNAWLEYKAYGTWILALAFGLGVHAALFALYRASHKGESMKIATFSLATSGSISAGAMAACFTHFMVALPPIPVLPFLAAVATGLARYQTYFFSMGILSSLFGIGLLFRMMVRNGMIQFVYPNGHENFKYSH